MTTRSLKRIADLVGAGLVPEGSARALAPVAARYAVAVTPTMARLMVPGEVADPIARQFLPDEEELTHRADEAPDPIGDAAHSPLKGLVHRYPDRVLLTPTLACPVYCRFCFRREVVGPGGARPMSPADLDAALAYIRQRPAIFEVIITGGDPLILPPARLAALVRCVAAIGHVRVLRFHSRVPVVAPEWINAALVRALRAPGIATYVALHANHPRELTPEAATALARLADAGIVLLGQTVLLAGVNDDAAVLEALWRGFVANRVQPYYLHHLDRAPGTFRFRVPLARGRALLKSLRGRLPGHALPTYVVDLPGGHGKSPVDPTFLHETGEGWVIEDMRGHRALLGEDDQPPASAHQPARRRPA